MMSLVSSRQEKKLRKPCYSVKKTSNNESSAWTMLRSETSSCTKLSKRGKRNLSTSNQPKNWRKESARSKRSWRRTLGSWNSFVAQSKWPSKMLWVYKPFSDRKRSKTANFKTIITKNLLPCKKVWSSRSKCLLRKWLNVNNWSPKLRKSKDSSQ